MAEVALVRKAVLGALINTWSKGPSVMDLLTDLGPVTKGGDSVDIPTDDGPTVHTSEDATPAANSMTREQLVVNEPIFVNRKLSVTQMAQMLNGNYANEVVKSDVGNFRNAVDTAILNKAFSSIAVTRHVNLAAAALTKGMINRTEARMLSQPGVTEGDLLWLMSPAFASEADALYPSVQATTLAASAEKGALPARSLNGIPMYRHMGVPGYLRRSATILSSAITGGNTLTLTMEDADHGFVAGQKVITDGLDVDQTAATAITSVSGATIVLPLTASNDATNGGGTLQSATGVAMLIAKSRGFFASDQLVPTSDIIKLQDSAGYTHQMFENIGSYFKAGGIYVLHNELVDAD